ncbi:spore cortex biosynthesis protein YabQ [Clostridium sp. DSM 8431]|uniref:spore cortex biosynthesis protein YabQ n=1 Tax=Clostridium sp. DSM 8431 TaxID=1761781 RepID=UPI0008F005C1|nr:spore cortex biosynthesis protein YabQ [Clostridium sp. DSM 8431]SFU89189.1 spore cortex biosynthesis protein YabQ [Clostridium sp. DSM 8431]
MPLELSVQFNIVIYSLLAGILTGMFFDVYRIIRGLNVNKILIWIEDLLFWILCSGIIFTFLLYFNYAFLGVYVYLFIFISLILYFKILSEKIIKIEKIIIMKIFKGFRITFKNIIYPLKIILEKMENKK